MGLEAIFIFLHNRGATLIGLGERHPAFSRISTTLPAIPRQLKTISFSMSTSASATVAANAIINVGYHIVRDEPEPEPDSSHDVTAAAARDTVIRKGTSFKRFLDEGYHLRTPKGLEFIHLVTFGDMVFLI